MKEDNNNQIMEKKENIFSKIGRFLKKIFVRKNNSKDEEKVESETIKQGEKENNFVDEIKIEDDPEKERLIKLQKDFREGKISQGDLSDEDIEKLGKLYDEQIEKLKIQIEDCKKRIEDKKQKLQKA